MSQTDLVYIQEVDEMTNQLKLGSLDAVGKTEWVNVSPKTLEEATHILKQCEEDSHPAIVNFDNAKKCIIHE